MPLFISVAISLSFAALFVGWCILERRRTSPRLWGGLVVTAVAVPVAYFVGAFSSSFNDNLCYSEVIAKLQQTQQSGKPVALPLYGYETSCREVRAALSLP